MELTIKGTNTRGKLLTAIDQIRSALAQNHTNGNIGETVSLNATITFGKDNTVNSFNTSIIKVEEQ